MAAKPTGTSIIHAGHDLMIALSNGTRPSTDYWGHTKAKIVIGKSTDYWGHTNAKLVIGKSQRGGKVKKQILFIGVFENGRQTYRSIH